MTESQGELTVGAIPGWLAKGAADLRASFGGSVAYATLFVVPGLLAQYWLVSRGYSLLYFILVGGFMLVAPMLLAGYNVVARQLHDHSSVGFGDALLSLARVPSPVWICGMLLIALYFIWVTDALMIYAFYFNFEPLPGLIGELPARSKVLAFLFYSGLLGSVLALVAFALSALSVPHAVATGAGFVEALNFSVRQVRRNLAVMAVWALIVGGSSFLVLLFVQPLALLLLPLLGYANMACYRRVAAAE